MVAETGNCDCDVDSNLDAHANSNGHRDGNTEADPNAAASTHAAATAVDIVQAEPLVCCAKASLSA
jgi:hypothetical protein